MSSEKEMAADSCLMGEVMESEIYVTGTAYESELATSFSRTSKSVREVGEQVERSRVHWSELSLPTSSEGITVQELEAPVVKNREVFKTLQSDPTWGSFFKTFDDGELVLGEKIAEGGQAEIFFAEWRINPADRTKRSIFEDQIELSKAHWTELAHPDEAEDENNDEDEDENNDEDEDENNDEDEDENNDKDEDENNDEDEDDNNEEDQDENNDEDEDGAPAKVTNKQAFKELQENSPWGKSFFYEFEEGEMVMAEKFAEGSQGELYHTQIKWRNSDSQKLFLRGKDLLKDGNEYVLKAFKKGTFLEDLKEKLPQAMLKFHATRIDSWMTRRYVCDVVCATLLPDGRFAFVLQKEQTDLRKLIDREKKLPSGRVKKGGPFPKEIAENFMYEIALGMNWLHDKGIVHRDLKASNVLVRESSWHYCFVADYECSVGTVGTGFWRAPEILEALKAKNVKPELFTEAADVYAYGMTCYEILTGEIPLEGHSLSDVYVHKKKPEVTEHVDSWVGELLKRCWQFNPQDRPSFGEILEVLRRNSAAIKRHEKRAHPKACEWTHQKTEMIPKDALKTIVSETRKQQSQHPQEVEAQVNWRSQYDYEYEPRSEHQSVWVLKVFKDTDSLEYVEKQLPIGLLELHADRSDRAKSGCSPSEWEKPRYICDVLCATLLKDGRFAYVLGREHQDLRRLIDRSMMTRVKDLGAPFPMAVAEKIMHDVACGVDWLHSYNIVHRDIKASNVLVSEDATGNYQCFICDYECSNGVTGTGFWRAPEILEAFKARNCQEGMEIFSKAADVYSYGMTCYEILTGNIPFECLRIGNYDAVLSGQRPEVPEYVDDWMRELLSRCWQSDPTARPSFWQIQKLFETPMEDRMKRLAEILDREAQISGSIVPGALLMAVKYIQKFWRRFKGAEKSDR